MDIYLKIMGGILIAVILRLLLIKQGSEISLLLCLAVCSMVVVATFSTLTPVLDFVERLTQLSNINSEVIEILLKTVGIGLLSQIVGLICDDAGNKSLAKLSTITATILILSISIPILENLLELLEMVMGEL